MNVVERRLSRKIMEVPLKDITPGLVIRVHSRGRLKAHLELGQTYRYYDLASLTKILFTASYAMMFFGKERKALHEFLSNVLPWWRKGTTPFELLTHTAGLEWWLPMYKRLKGPLNPVTRWQQMRSRLKNLKSRTRKQAVYSDVDLWLLRAYLEAKTETSLLEMWSQTQERMNIDDIYFHPRNRPRLHPSNYAPTERCPWRKRVLQGEVHDENTWALGGVSLNAGLFGGAEAVSAWGLELRKAYLGQRSALIEQSLVRHFTNRRLPHAIGDWGLGFMKPTLGNASCGKYFSRRSFGHTGFTGTSFWYDPVKDLQVVVLSNRVHPHRSNNRFKDLRPLLHDWVCESLD